MINNKGYTLIEVLITFFIVCIFIVISYTIISQVTIASNKCSDLDQTFRELKNISSELKSRKILTDSGYIEINGSILKETITFRRKGLDVTISGKELLDDGATYLARIDIKNTNQDLDYCVYVMVRIDTPNYIKDIVEETSI